MFEIADLTRIQLDLIKGVPPAYSNLLIRLNREGLTQMDWMDETKNSRMCGILNEYYDQYILRA